MAKSVIKRILVIGDEPGTLVAKYAAETKVEPYVKYRFDDRERLRENQLRTIEAILNSPTIRLTESQREVYKNLYIDTQESDPEEFYETITYGMDIDDTTGDVYSTENPEAKYKYPSCKETRLRETGEESDFSNPFKLKDGTKSYMARKGDIDWPKNHMANTEIYRAAWELCVEGREAKNETERTIKQNMENRRNYFANFRDVDEYVRHSCCFWVDSVVTQDGKYYGLDYKTSDRKWISEFYDRFIKGLPDDTLLTLYEARSLND